MKVWHQWDLPRMRALGVDANTFQPWRDGWLLPFPCTAMVDDPACPYQVELELTVVRGRVECGSARFVQRKDGPAVTPRLVRSVPLTAYVKAAVAALAVSENELTAERMTTEQWDAYRSEATAASRDVLDERKRGRRPKEDAHLRAVAKVFREAELAGQPARRAVERDRRWGPVSPSTAARWIRAARDAGLLDEPKRRTQ